MINSILLFLLFWKQHPDILATQANSILTAVVQGARKEEPSEEVRLAAIEALYNSLEFVKENFGREGERNYIMQVICEATQSKEIQVQIVAFECLVRIMQLYYDKMPFYMQKAVFGVSHRLTPERGFIGRNDSRIDS